MRSLLLLLLLAPYQLTWYEHYEDGERLFQKGDYRGCIARMDAALKERPEPKRNQFTRAVQKIDYKPFYYQALAHYRLGELERAYQTERSAWRAKRRESERDWRREVAAAFLADPTQRAMVHPSPSPIARQTS